ncbi:helix-turn-helix domain-containing protein [Devosia enhydra]|uniref:helix-turn-helix domain-containing protein n=1 Tax=Devosia enhydra TaxID=665118 RepID=UPI0015A550AB
MLLTSKEACRYLNCKESVLNRLTGEGIIPYYQLGRRRLFAEEDLAHYEEDWKAGKVVSPQEIAGSRRYLNFRMWMQGAARRSEVALLREKKKRENGK